MTGNDKQKTIALIIVSLVALLGFGLFAFKRADRSRELHYAIMRHDHAYLEELLKDHPRLVEAELPNRSPRDTWLPLHLAAYGGNTRSAEILLKHKAKVNARDSNELTPLHYAVSSGRHECVNLLINKGADMNAKGRDGRTPLDLAKNLRDKEMIRLFRIRGAKE